MRSNYESSSPNNETKEYYHDKITEIIVNYPDIVEKLISSINVNDNEDQSYDVKVVSAKFYFHKPITVHLELYLFYCFIHFLLYIGQY